MSAFVMSIFKATAGLLVDKARERTVEMLKDGDVADEAFRKLIVSRIDDIKGKLHGLARKDLLSSIMSLKAGIVNLNQVFEPTFNGGNDKAAVKAVTNSREEGSCVTDGSAQGASLVTEAIRDLKLVSLGESAKKLLKDAEKRFGEARNRATDAFNNEGLSTSDRILALKIQLMATILERVDRPEHAVAECILCLEYLHDMPVVQKSFKVHLTGGIKARFDKEERDAIIIAVCQINYVGFRLIQVIKDGRGDAITLPPLRVDNNEFVDVLRDERVVKRLIKLEMAEFCRGVWSLGQEGEADQKLKQPFRLATNSNGEFIVADDLGTRRMKVYSSGGKFLKSVRFNFEAIHVVHSLATDRHNNVYVLAESADANSSRSLYVFTKYGTPLQQREFILKEDFIGTSVTVSDRSDEVFILGGDISGNEFYVEVYDAFGEFIHSFGKEVLKHPNDIAAADDGRVFVLMDLASPCVHTFSAEGKHLKYFSLRGGWCSEGSIALGRGVPLTVVVSLWGRNCTKNEKVSIYSGEGTFMCDVVVFDEEVEEAAGHKIAQDVAVTADGRVAVIARTPKKATCKICQEICIAY